MACDPLAVASTGSLASGFSTCSPIGLTPASALPLLWLCCFSSPGGERWCGVLRCVSEHRMYYCLFVCILCTPLPHMHTHCACHKFEMYTYVHVFHIYIYMIQLDVTSQKYHVSIWSHFRPAQYTTSLYYIPHYWIIVRTCMCMIYMQQWDSSHPSCWIHDQRAGNLSMEFWRTTLRSSSVSAWWRSLWEWESGSGGCGQMLLHHISFLSNHINVFVRPKTTNYANLKLHQVTSCLMDLNIQLLRPFVPSGMQTSQSPFYTSSYFLEKYTAFFPYRS